jgi:RHS repeat-associated protein
MLRDTWRAGLVAGWISLFVMVGCKSTPSDVTPGSAESAQISSVGTASDTESLRVASALIDGGAKEGGGAADAANTGPNCSSSGDPFIDAGMRDGGSCTGILAQSTFTRAVCSCGTLTTSAPFVTDGFNSTIGPPDGGLGGNVGSDSYEVWSNTVTIGGDFTTAGNWNVSSPATVRGNLSVGGALNVSAAVAVKGNASSVQALPKNVTVAGTTAHVSSVVPPCDCTDIVPVASIVAAHRPPANDNASIGLSASAASGANNPARIDLPCGNYYLTQISTNEPLTIAVHGHTALYVDGNISASAALTIQIDPTATLDLFVSGAVSASSSLTLGSTSYPSRCRAYVAGSSVTLSQASTLGCNLYAPTASFGATTTPAIYGSLFVGGITVSAPTTIHYDQAIQNAQNECCTAATCDDGNPCTVDTCNGDGTCSHTNAANGTSCTGTNKCEQTYTCHSGVCTGSNPVTCTASDQCHVPGTCDPSTGKCSNPDAPNGTACNDGNACDLNDTCQSGVCAASSHVTCTASDQCHVAGTCNPATGQCSNPPVANGTACNDGNACDLNDTCQSGVCTAGSHVTCTASDQCHVAGTCNPATGQCSNPPVANGTACNDGNACDLNDTCQSGVCTAGNHVTCTASDQCHVAGTCDSNSGTCSNPQAANGTSCNDGNTCTQTDSCQNGTCTGSNPVICTAEDQCHVAGTCDPTTGVCSNPISADGTACTGSNKCNQTYACAAGACTGSNPVTCTSPQPAIAATQAMSSARSQHAAVKLPNGDVLVVGGTTDGTTPLASVETFHVAGANWSSAAAMERPRYGHTATLLGSGKVLVAGGVDSSGSATTSTEMYDPSANAWTPGPPMSTARAGGGAVALPGGKVLVVGGASAGGPVSEVFDPAAGAWSTIPGGPAAVAANALAILADGRVLAAGGTDASGAATSATSLYDPASDAWSTVAPMPAPRAGAVAVLLPTGAVVVAGGSAPPSTQALADAFLYVPATNTWTTAAPMSTGRGGGAGAVLPDGRGLVAGGGASGADLFDPVASSWSAVASSTTRTHLTATLTGAGTTLIAGGADSSANALASADVFSASDAQCTKSTCDPESGQCSTNNKTDGTACNDGNACLQTQACQGGFCVGSNPVQCTSAGRCQAGLCDPLSGACSSVAVSDGTPCNDGNLCTQGETCTAGACSGTAVVCPPPDQCHQAGSCNPTTGACAYAAVADGTSCDDGNACTQADTCQAGVCTGGSPLTCTASDQCHVAGACDPTTGLCSNPVASDGTGCLGTNLCNQSYTCQSGLCTGSNPVTCAASDQCHLSGTCDPSTGTCSNPAVTNGTSCNDGNACTQVDACQNGTCTGANPVVCTASDACHVAGTCDPTSGICSNPAASDGTLCTGTNRCNQSYACVSGTCTGESPVTCTASDACHLVGTCNPSTGVCSNPTAPNGTSCNDGNACTQTDSCQNGTCVGVGTVTCTALDQCHTVGTCDPRTGCSNPPLADGTPCSGSDKCNQVYECTGGTCLGTSPVTCVASDPCHVPGTCDPSAGSCSNPAAPDGTACNDHNACTRSDSCQGGKCAGSNPVTCAALDACHLPGTCNAGSGACSNPNAPDGTTCSTGDASTPQVCSAGACVAAATTCASPQTPCNGLCVSTQSDSKNCGACGNVCAKGYSCAAGSCISPQVLASCVPAGSLAIASSTEGVVAYVPNASWSGLSTGIQRVVVEGGTASAVMIPTGTAVNSCAANWVTGETVCTDNGSGVYIIKGGKLTATRGDGSNSTQLFSGGSCNTCGVVVDANTNLAILSIGRSVNVSGMVFADVGAFQTYDMTANSFAAPVSLGLNPISVNGYTASEQPAIDPIRQFVLSPNEFGNFQMIKYVGTPAVYNNTQFPTEAHGRAVEFDSAAVDCTTGIALAASENGPAAVAQLTLVDTSQAVFTPGTPSGTWSAPNTTVTLDNLPWITGQYPDRVAVTLGVAPGSHLGLVAEEFGGGTLIALSLPSAAGLGPPNLKDWAVGTIVQDPTGALWTSFADPHGITAYTSPRTGRAMAVVSNSTSNYQLEPTFLARIDLQSLLDAPRLPGSHNVDPSYDLVANGVVTFVEMLCAGVDLSTDPNNCGTCGTVCPVGANAEPTCNVNSCGIVCNQGFANCGESPVYACPVNLSTDPLNCGACNNSCAQPNAAGVCTAGQCGFVCNSGFSDCVRGGGCETQGQCPPPVVGVSGPTTAIAGQAATFTATATGAQTRTLSYAWTELSGPGTALIGSPTALTTTVVFPQKGSYVLQFAASDGFSTSTAQLTVNVTLVNQPPVISAGSNQVLTSPLMSTTLTASITDDGEPLGASLTSTWSLVSGPVAVSIATPAQSTPEPGPLVASTAVTFSYPGTYVFQLEASDSQLSASAATTTVTVTPPTAVVAGAAPTVAIGGVTDDQTVSNPTKIQATVSDGSWVLERRRGGRDDVQTSWMVMASGTGTENSATVATLDPTTLINGIYTVRLSSTNSAGSASTSLSLSVEGRMKVGNFTLAFTDIEVNLGGLPLIVTRTYDSRDKSVGDFGVGWKLGISDVRVDKSGKTGGFWSQQFINLGLIGEFCLTPLQAETVAVTFPSGRQYRFTPQANPPCQPDVQITTPDIVWVSTSDPGNPNIQLSATEQTSVFAFDSGSGVTQLQDSQGNVWDPRQFILTIEDGSVWQVDQELGVTEMQDRNGNFVTVSPSGIVHSSGAQVTFARDAQNRITRVTDPAGASASYGYDGNGDLAKYTDRLAKATQFGYEANHYLETIQDPLGRQPIRNEYDSNNRLVSTTDAAGNTVQYAPNLAANQEQVADRLGHVTVYTYNEEGDITQKVDATGAVWNYTYDVRGDQLTAIDPLGRTTTKTFDGASNALTTTDPLGNVTTNTYNGFREILTSTDALGRVTANTYDSAGNLLTTIDPVGNATHYTYDGQGNRLTETDALNHTTQYSYDGAGHLTQVIDPLGHATNYKYDANGHKVFQSAVRHGNTSSSEIVTAYTNDAQGRVLQSSMGTGRPGDGPVRSTTYTATGKRATDTDPLGRVTSYSYDALDRLVSTTRPDGTVTRQAYDAEGRRVSSTDAAGNVTTYAYDPVGRLVRTTFADGSSTSMTYDGAGQVMETVDELGNVRWSEYDAAGHLASTTDPLGAVTVYSYDAVGNRTSTLDALGRTTVYAYDADNRLVATTYPDGGVESVGYDGAGHVVNKADALNQSTGYNYDAAGRLVRVVDALGNVTAYGLDELGLTLAMQPPNAHGTSTTFVYDSFTNVRTGRFLPDGSGETFKDDAAGQIIQHTDFNGMTTSYAYDPMGRVLSRTYPDGSVLAFTYTPTGQRATATDRRGTTRYAYDSRNRLVSVTESDGRQLAYGYDAHGDRTRLTAQIGATPLTTTTSYDGDYRPTAVVDPLGRAFAFAYDAAGNRVSASYPNGASASYSYDARDRLTDLATTVEGAPVASFAYVLDAAGRRTQVSEADGTVRRYGYDSIDRLTAEQVTGSLSYARTFSYDPVGNRLTQTGAGAAAGADGGTATVSYAYDTRDRLLTENATTYSYDSNGNVTGKSGEASYQWDFENRLVQATMAGSNLVVSHVYDADGNRTQTSVTPPSTGSLACQGNSATFVREDYATRGNWQGTYGADGYYINAVTPAPPAYGSVSFTNTNNFTWTSNTSDVRALQQPPPLTSRIASTYYTTTTETVHVATTDGNAHVVAFYLLDWDSERRTETATAQTPTGTVLDAARPFGSFSGGVWAVYTICGSVDFVFTLTGGPNAVVSGVFFGPPPGAATTTNMLVDPAGCPSCGGSGLSQVIADTDVNGNLAAYYVRVRDELLEVMRRGSTQGTWTTRYAHHDGLESVRALTDETGTTTDTRGYEAFGTKNVEAGSDPLAYGFAGEPFEPTSILAYHRARWMDARVGRFESPDPLAEMLRWPNGGHWRSSPLSVGAIGKLGDLYLYTSDDPVQHIDPSGRFEASLSFSLVTVAVVTTLAVMATPSYRAVVADVVSGIKHYTEIYDDAVPEESGEYERCYVIPDLEDDYACYYSCPGDTVQAVPKAIPIEPGVGPVGCDPSILRPYLGPPVPEPPPESGKFPTGNGAEP